MRFLLILTFFALLIYSPASTQEKSLYIEGRVKLTIRLKGENTANLKISPIRGSNILSLDRGIKSTEINDSTIVISEHTFGPTPIYFTFGQNYFSTVLLPNESDTLEIDMSDAICLKTEYTGIFHDIFNNSKLLVETIQKVMFESGVPDNYNGRRIRTSADLKNTYLHQIDELKQGIARENITNTTIEYFRGVPEMIKLLDLMTRHDSYFTTLNMQNGMDSVTAAASIPIKDNRFYQGLVTDRLTDSNLIHPSGYRTLITRIINDPDLELGNIRETGILTFKKKLEDTFKPCFSRSGKFFYDNAIAIAFLNSIGQGEPLTNEEKREIKGYFTNKGLTNYILQIDDQDQTYHGSSTDGKYYLTFDSKNQDVLGSILNKYKGKAIVIDFWATWCGPCIDNFQKFAEVRKKYANSDDIVFIYLTDQTSQKEIWNDFVKSLGGEHYYLYSEQHYNILNEFELQFLPSYLFFNKNGELYNKVGGAVTPGIYSQTIDQLTRLE